MKHSLISTNVIIRDLVEDPDTIRPKFKGMYAFFGKVEIKTVYSFDTDLKKNGLELLKVQ